MNSQCNGCPKYTECVVKYHIPAQEFADDMQKLLNSGYGSDSVRAFIAAERASDSSIVLDRMSFIIDKVVWDYEKD